MAERLTDEEVLELIKADRRLYRQLKERPGPIEIELEGEVYVLPSLQEPLPASAAAPRSPPHAAPGA